MPFPLYAVRRDASPKHWSTWDWAHPGSSQCVSLKAEYP